MNAGHDQDPAAGRKLRVAVLVLSDRCSAGLRPDLSGPALADWLAARDAAVTGCDVIPDDRDAIAARLEGLCDDGGCDVVLTCGGTGVSPRDVTPEATRAVLDLELPGFAEAMRAASARLTPHALISRALAGARRGTLVINLPGSPRAAVENLEAVWAAVPHAAAKLRGDPRDCATARRNATIPFAADAADRMATGAVAARGRLEAVCLSAAKGTVKSAVPVARLEAGHGLVGDAHAGPWHRQVSLLAGESVDRVREVLPGLVAGAFAENLVLRGLDLAAAQVGDRFEVGPDAVLEVTQIGKECHQACAIGVATGDCIMPREGLFCRVLAGGEIRPGDAVSLRRAQAGPR